MSIARTTPAQKPRGWARITFITLLQTGPAPLLPGAAPSLDSPGTGCRYHLWTASASARRREAVRRGSPNAVDHPVGTGFTSRSSPTGGAVSYTHLRAHE